MQSAPAPDQPIDPEWSRAFEQNRADRERARADQERATIEAAAVDAADLYAAYDANEVQADVTYRNRRIYVRGVVTEIGKDFLDAPFVTLRGLDDFSGVECTFSKSDEPELAGVRKGQTLTISGKCSGKIVMMVLVEGSKIAGRE